MPSPSSSVDIGTMIANLAATASSLQSLVVAASYIIGIGLIIKGVMKYKSFGHGMNQHTPPGEGFAPMLSIMVGSILMYLPSIMATSLTTVFGTAAIGSPASVLSYSSTLSSNAQWSQLGAILINYFQLVGLIAFIRGWMILSKITQQGGQDTVGKALTHIVGGIMLVNLVGTIQILATTFGFSGH